MHKYLPNTKADIEKMLKVCGVDSIEDLFEDIPKENRYNHALNIPGPYSELEIEQKLSKIANKNSNAQTNAIFLGGGVYDHYIPSIIKHLILRSEFYTAYTPYQPEISQGTLQAIFEYQTMICNLTDMEVSNASLYDGATAAAEAMMMACDITRRKKVIVSETVHPQTRQIIKTYAKHKNITYEEIEEKNGTTNIKDMVKKVDDQCAGVLLQSPNFFGEIEDFDEAEHIIHQNKSQMVISCDPISLSFLKTPGEINADIAVGEGQSLGNPMGFGGPYLGFIATRDKHKRKLPGRIVGQTVDLDDKRGYVLTLQAREQHIRREKATSNITSNEALVALCAAMYMSIMGRNGLVEVSKQCINKASYLLEELIAVGCKRPFYGPIYKEFVVELPPKVKIENLNQRLLEANIIGGFSINKYYKKYPNAYLIAVTEKRTKEEMDKFVKVIGGMING